MKRIIICASCLTVLLHLNLTSAHAENHAEPNNRPEFNIGLGLFYIRSVDLPTSLRKTPVHPDDTSWAGDSRLTDLDSGVIPSLDLGVSIKPLSWKYFDNLRFGYTLRTFFYSPGYEEGITGRELYTNPTYESYTYTKISDVDTFAHELYLDYGWTFENESRFAIGTKYLFWGIEVEQGWDRYAQEETWRSTDGDVRGFIPFVSYGLCTKSTTYTIVVDYADLNVDFGSMGDGDMRGLNFRACLSWRF
jgi:hypothetical protein